jgi:hypothetical protein
MEVLEVGNEVRFEMAPGSGFFPMVLAPLFLATGTDLIIYGKLAQAADRLTAFCASKLH